MSDPKPYLASQEDAPLPDWVYEQAAAKKAAGIEMRGLIAIIPSGVDPEAYMASKGFA